MAGNYFLSLSYLSSRLLGLSTGGRRQTVFVARPSLGVRTETFVESGYDGGVFAFVFLSCSCKLGEYKEITGDYFCP